MTLPVVIYFDLFQAQINSDRILQESLRAQGWGCNQEQPLQPRKRDLEDDPGHNVRG